ncbi:hypothetical protein PI27_gp111 [Listeria phage WIL-1]|nr:hypothetical protein PI27_gp111 [Listeria phage WIL-1]
MVCNYWCQLWTNFRTTKIQQRKRSGKR